MTDDVETSTDMSGRVRHEAIELVRFIVGAAAVFLLITTVIFRTFYIPSGSMQPTLEIGDRVVVLNFAYGWSRHSLQFGHSLLPDADDSTGCRRILCRTPERGHVVVFRHPQTGAHLIKRVVGVPGDQIRVEAGRLYVNGELADRDVVDVYRYRDTRSGGTPLVTRYDEQIPGGPTHPIFEVADNHGLDNTGLFVVPVGHIFVMGDNRDSSRDSRDASLGYVPIENLVGRAVTVLFTLNRCRDEPGIRCPTGRVLRPL